MDRSTSVAIIIPSYNEALSIGDTLNTLTSLYADQADIIVVDDGSTDDTGEIVRHYESVTLIRHKRNYGYGAAIKTGIASARTKLVCLYDADGQHRSNDIARLIEAIGDADMVVGSRRLWRSKSLLRTPGKIILHILANMLVKEDIPDLNSGLRLIKREVILRYVHLLPDGFSASTTTTMALMTRGYDVKFVPIEVHPRVGKSQVKQVRDGFQTIMLILRVIMLFNPLRFFMPFSMFFMSSSLTYGIYKILTNDSQGFPVGAYLIFSVGVIGVPLGLIADQISSLRLERFENQGTVDQRISTIE